MQVGGFAKLGTQEGFAGCPQDSTMGLNSLKGRKFGPFCCVDQVFFLKKSILITMEDRFAQVPGDILDLIFLNCDLKDTSSLSRVCKKFYSRINNERMWKERSIALWKEKSAPHPISEIERIKEKVNMLSWKRQKITSSFLPTSPAYSFVSSPNPRMSIVELQL